MICLQPLSKSTLDCFRGGGAILPELLSTFAYILPENEKNLPIAASPPTHTHRHTLCMHLLPSQSVFFSFNRICCMHTKWLKRCCCWASDYGTMLGIKGVNKTFYMKFFSNCDCPKLSPLCIVIITNFFCLISVLLFCSLSLSPSKIAGILLEWL